MGFFSFLFDKPVTVKDKVFGKMHFVSFGEDADKSYFESEPTLFAPTKRLVGCFVDADASGPTPAQRVFFRQLEANYPALTQTLAPFLEQELQQWRPGFKIQDFGAEFWPVSLSIPRLNTRPVQWEWSFGSVHDSKRVFTIRMSENTPLPGIVLDA